jgi:hypothetical protein
MEFLLFEIRANKGKTDANLNIIAEIRAWRKETNARRDTTGAYMETTEARIKTGHGQMEADIKTGSTSKNNSFGGNSIRNRCCSGASESLDRDCRSSDGLSGCRELHTLDPFALRKHQRPKREIGAVAGKQGDILWGPWTKPPVEIVKRQSA